MIIFHKEGKRLSIGVDVLRQWRTRRSLMDKLSARTWLLNTLHWKPGNTLHVWYRERGYELGRNGLCMFSFGRFQLGFCFFKTIRTKAFNLSCNSGCLILFEFVRQARRRLSTYDDGRWLYIVPDNSLMDISELHHSRGKNRTPL